ncbi:MAG: large-conductance mechanosensitive channel protein MscL [Verrucomicrobiota bacterium]
MRILKEFKEFAMKGNVLDMAVGIIIGGAFGKIVSSLVNDIIMPPLGWLMGGIDFKDKVLVLKEALVDAAGTVTTPAVAISYGAFINQVLDFTIVALSIFILVKAMNTLKRKEEAKPASPPQLPPDVALLAEIRDILKTR